MHQINKIGFWDFWVTIFNFLNRVICRTLLLLFYRPRLVLISGLIFGFILYFSPVNGQANLTGLTKYQLLKYSERAEQLNDYFSQTQYIEAYLQKYPDDLKMIFKLGNAYYNIRNYKEASIQFEKCKNSDSKYKKQATFYFGICQKNMGNYSNAITAFNWCISQKKEGELVRTAKMAKQGCQLAIDSLVNYREVDFTHFDSKINSPHLDINPIYIDENHFLYITNSIDSTVQYNLQDNESRASRKFKLAGWNTPQSESKSEMIFNDQIGTSDVLGGAFSVDGLRFYFTVGTKDWKNKTVCEIYVSEKKGNEWLPPFKIPAKVNLNGYSSPHVCVGGTYNPEIEVVYFSSDRPNGFGGMDIWFTAYNKTLKTYTEPRNCGAKINTPFDEVTPFYDLKTKKLFFSSNQWMGYGGFDVYYSQGSLKDWSPSKLCEYPLNSNADEIYYTLNPDLNSGFFVSNRPGTFSFLNEYCCYDIFAYKFRVKNLPVLAGKVEVSLDTTFSKYLNRGIRLRVTDSVNLSKDYYNQTYANLYLIPEKNEPTLLIESRHLTDSGTYAFTVVQHENYKIEFSHNGKIIGISEISSNDLSDSVEHKMQNLLVSIIPNKPIEISNIYYPLNESSLSSEAKENLNKALIPLLRELPNINIQLFSHTDNLGTETYNLELSQRRANEVVNFLVSQGITRNRVASVGLGESQPIAPNSLPDGTDNPEGRAMNRRTEFIIVENK